MTTTTEQQRRAPTAVVQALGRRTLDRWPLGLLTLGTFAVYALFALERHRQFNTAGYDLGIFDQAVRRYAHFQAPVVPLKGMGYNIWGDHFHPIIATAAPLYWIWGHPQTLLVLQAALVASSVPVVYRFAHRRTTSRASLVICFAYASSWAFQTLIDFQVHEVAWAIPILALAIDALDRHDDRQLLVFAGLLLLVREDMGILVLLLGILRLFTRPRRWIGLVLVGAGVIGYELATAVILPHFSPDQQFAYWQYGPTLGPNLGSAAGHVVLHPVDTLRLFFSPMIKTQTLLLFLVPVLFLALRSRYVILAIPLLAQRFFEPKVRDNLWYPSFHYNALPWVIFTLAMIDGAARLGVWTRPRVKVAVLMVLAAIPVALVIVNPPFSGRRVAALHALVNGKLFATTAHMRAQQAVVDRIPRYVCVEADDRLAGHLTDRDYVTLFGMQHDAADFVAIDLTQKDVGNFGPKPAAALATARAAGYVEIYRQDNVVLLRSPTYRGPSSRCGPLGSGPA
jgi:uncharacterized membrane protein